MRVISGIRKGHRLKAPKNMNIRPTEDKTKESLFNILGHIRDDSIILDLFGGSGAIGIEFLSRGAKECYFVDISPKSISLIEENLIHTKLMDRSVIFKRDGIKAIEYFHREGVLFDYIFIDPPFNQHRLLFNVLEAIEKNMILKDDGLIIIEHEKDLPLEDETLGLEKIDYRKYGSKSITFYRRSL